jgi:hypothetical protein
MSDKEDELARKNVKRLSDNPIFQNAEVDAPQNSYSHSIERDFNTFSIFLKRLKDEAARQRLNDLQNQNTITAFVKIREFIKGDHDYARQIMSSYQEVMKILDEDTRNSFLTAIYDEEESRKAFTDRPWEHIETFLLGYVSEARVGNFVPLETELAIGILARQKFESFFDPKLYAKSSKMAVTLEELYEAHDMVDCRIWQSKIYVALQTLKEKDFARMDFRSNEESRKWMDRYYCTVTERSEENTQVRIYEETLDTISRFEKKEFLLEFERKSVFLPNAKGQSVRFDIARDWLSVPHRHYDRIIFDRGAPFDRDSTTLNKFRGYAVKPSKNGSYDLFKQLWKEGLCADDEGLFKWTFGWHSFLYKRPGEKTGTSIVWKGVK